MKKKKVAIVVSGTLCPGINPLLKSLIRPRNRVSKFEFVGIRGGYSGLRKGELEPDSLRPLTVLTDWTIAYYGSVLGTSDDTLIGSSEADLSCATAALRALQSQGISDVVGIGAGEAVASLHRLSMAAEAEGIPLRVLHLPTALHNDLPRSDHGYPLGVLTAQSRAAEDLTLAAINAQHSDKRLVIGTVPDRRTGLFTMKVATSYLHRERPDKDYPLVFIPEIFPRQATPDEFNAVLQYGFSQSSDWRSRTIILADGVVQKLSLGFQAELCRIGMYEGRNFASALAHFVSRSFNVRTEALEIGATLRALKLNKRDGENLAVLVPALLQALQTELTKLSLKVTLTMPTFHVVATPFEDLLDAQGMPKISTEIHDQSMVLEETRWRLRDYCV